MKIAFIVHTFPILSESFVVNQITGLLDMGHDVRIFAAIDPCQSEVNADVLKYKLTDKTKYIVLPKNKNIRRFKTLFLVLLYMLRCPLLVINALWQLVIRKERFSYELLYYIFALAANDFDIIHAHFGPSGNIGIFLKKVGIKAKLITTFYGYDFTSYINRTRPDIYSNLFKVSDMFTYISEAARQKIEALGCPPEKMFKIAMGIHLDRFEFTPRSPGPENLIRILSVGRLVEMKGREYAIKAFAEVAKKNPNIRYNIVGDGELRETLEEMVRQLGMTEKICIHGWVSTEKLQSLYEMSHIFLHPSVLANDGNQEGQGVVLVEAQAVGMPVLATKHGAFPETVKDGSGGFLVPERDVESLAEKLAFLVDNPQLWPEIGQNGRKHAELNYDINVLNKKLEKLYIKLIENN